jgi:acyl-CoA synthetase (NDP forming)
VESFGNPRKFAGTARPVAQRMPVLTVIGARSPAGHRASSHTALSATPLVHQAMFDRAGVIATRSLGELVDTAALLASQPLPAADTAALADALLRVSRLADDRPEVSELDPNPVVAGRTASGAWTCGCGSARQSPGIPSCAGCCEYTPAASMRPSASAS